MFDDIAAQEVNDSRLVPASFVLWGVGLVSAFAGFWLWPYQAGGESGLIEAFAVGRLAAIWVGLCSTIGGGLAMAALLDRRARSVGAVVAVLLNALTLTLICIGWR